MADPVRIENVTDQHMTLVIQRVSGERRYRLTWDEAAQTVAAIRAYFELEREWGMRRPDLLRVIEGSEATP